MKIIFSLIIIMLIFLFKILFIQDLLCYATAAACSGTLFRICKRPCLLNTVPRYAKNLGRAAVPKPWLEFYILVFISRIFYRLEITFFFISYINKITI